MIGQRIKYYRLKRQMNKSELSAALGIKVENLTALENGKKQPDLKIVRALMSVFGVKLKDIADVPYEHQKYEHLEIHTL